MQQNKQFDVIFIRHAQSQANLQTQNFINKHNIIYEWQYLSKNKPYLENIKYSFNLVDPSITKEGFQQCQQAKEQLSGYQPDLILVSPLRRALMTCQQIFKQIQCPVIVEPSISQGLRSSADYSDSIEVKKKQFPSYDFSRVQNLGPFWFITNESEVNQEKYKKMLEENKGKGYEETIKALLAEMMKNFIYESPTNLRRRTERVKLMLKEYKKEYKSIAVVTHYNIVRFTLANEFNQRDEPFHCHIGNCEISKRKIDSL